MESTTPVRPVDTHFCVEPTESHDGSKMEGNFSHGTGFGKRIFRSGHIWEGNFVNSFLEGEGKHIFPDGTVWSGHFKRSKIDGIGVVTRPDGTTQDVVFENNKIVYTLGASE